MKTISWKEIEEQNKKNCFVDDLEKENEVLRKTLVRVSNEKDRIIDKQNIDYLSFASQLRHEICEKIRKCSQNVSVYKEGLGLTDCYAIEEIILQEIENGEE